MGALCSPSAMSPSLSSPSQAMVRVAHCKALPTDEQIAAAGRTDAYDFLTYLKANETLAYDRFIAQADGEWWHSARQPITSAVRHMLCLIRRTTEARLGRLQKTSISSISTGRSKASPSTGGGGKTSGEVILVKLQGGPSGLLPSTLSPSSLLIARPASADPNARDCTSPQACAEAPRHRGAETRSRGAIQSVGERGERGRPSPGPLDRA